MSFGQEEIDAVLRVMRAGTLSGYQGNFSEQFWGGPEVQALEQEWCKYFKVKHAVFCNSATSGLWAACNAINLKPGDECLVSPYSMTCSASIPLAFGARPVFVDIEKDYYCIDADKIEEQITDKTRAIIAVDLFGLPADYDKIKAIAKKHNLIVIEDAAQSIGATYKGKYAGTLTDIGVFSLNRHKHINCGEGGVICTDNDDLAFKLRLSINHCEAVVNDIARQGEIDKFSPDILSMMGMNLRGTELSAAIAREQLKKLDGIVKVQQDLAKHFPVKVRPGCEHAFYRYAVDGKIGVDEYLERFDDFRPFNIKNGYITPLYQMPLFEQLGYPDGLCPICEEVEQNIVLAWLKENP